ncbi:protease modulator HflC [uncultured Shewanella sp.]|uniref:protease modulator HflC n=1 Tax=uncultured Shewanella sp. TaxID=173975 RepID=UPI002625868B|nr:protease modulator HflC [uncultured Shewanella sp.]
MGRLTAIIIALVIAIGLSSLMVVNEGERAIVSRFGVIIKVDGKTKVYSPGLHLKVPFLDKVKYLDARIQTLDGQADRFVTSEKKDLMVDSYVKWKISDFERYYLSTNGGQKATAESLLQRKINNDLRTEFGRRTIKQIVSGERDEMQSEALKNAKDSAADLGIKVVDVRVKQINLPANVSSSIYQRMRAERQAVAKEHRAQGREQAEIIRARTDASVTVQIAEAQKKALTTRGEGDALAAKIYSDSYSKAPDLYSFMRSLDAYKASFANGSNVMVLDPDNEFFKFMKSPTGK